MSDPNLWQRILAAYEWKRFPLNTVWPYLVHAQHPVADEYHSWVLIGLELKIVDVVNVFLVEGIDDEFEWLFA